MNGLELSRAFYEQYGKPMLESDFSQYIDRIAVGLVGHGSECFGYDDEISKDHDYKPGFCLWLTPEDEKEFGFKLFRAYNKLPTEFEGVKIIEKNSFGTDYKGVIIIPEFYRNYLGSDSVPTDNIHWLSIPEYALAEATNGEVFCDPLGEFSRIRNELLFNRPNDVRLKKLASALFYMAQSGQYNYSRCIKHGEFTAAAIALSDFCKNTAFAVFLLNNTYAPYYKWLFRKLGEQKKLSNIADELKVLMHDPFDCKKNSAIIEKISSEIINELKSQKLCNLSGDYLEPFAWAVCDNIRDGNLRNMPIML